MASYDNPMRLTYLVAAASVSADANLLNIAGPVGLQGKVVAISAVVTTGVTSSDSDIIVGDGADDDKFATLVVPISSTNAVANDPTLLTLDDNLIPADSRVVIGSGGAAAAGVVGLTVVIDWF